MALNLTTVLYIWIKILFYYFTAITMIVINYLLVVVLSELLIGYGEAQEFGTVPPLPVTGMFIVL